MYSAVKARRLLALFRVEALQHALGVRGAQRKLESENENTKPGSRDLDALAQIVALLRSLPPVRAGGSEREVILPRCLLVVSDDVILVGVLHHFIVDDRDVVAAVVMHVVLAVVPCRRSPGRRGLRAHNRLPKLALLQSSAAHRAGGGAPAGVAHARRCARGVSAEKNLPVAAGSGAAAS